MKENMKEDIEENIVELEKKVAYQELAISELSDVVYKQQEEIDFLKKKIKIIQDKISDNGVELNPNTKPPHY